MVSAPPSLSPHDLPDDLGDLSAHERAAQTRDLLLAAAAADDATREALLDQAVLLNIGVAKSLALRYHGRGVPDDDLIQTAYLGLVKAARGYQPEKSPDFLRFAAPTILGEVKRYFRDHAWTVKPPRRVQELQPQVWAAAERFSRAHGRAPTPHEIAVEIEVEVGDVEEALAANKCFAPDSIDYTSSGDAHGASLMDLMGDEDAGFARAEAVAALAPLCRALSERDRRIVYLRFFHEWTQARIAEEFGVTQMQISRLLNRVLLQLRDGLADTAEPARGDARDAAIA